MGTSCFFSVWPFHPDWAPHSINKLDPKKEYFKCSKPEAAPWAEIQTWKRQGFTPASFCRSSK